MSSSHSPLPLELLFPRLEAAGFSLNTARRLRVWRVLNAEGGRFAGDMEGLKFLLCPLLARTPQEQQRFYMIFEQFWGECVKEWEEWPDAEGVEVVEDKADGDLTHPPFVRKQWLKYLGWALALVALALGAYFVWKIYFTEKVRSPKALFGWETRRISKEQGLLTGDTVDLINDSKHFDSTKVHWEIKEKETRKVLHADSSMHTTWVAPESGKNVSITLKVLAKSHPDLPKDTSLWQDSLFSTYQVEHTIQCTDAPKAGEIATNASTYIAGKPYKFEIELEKGCYASWDFNTQRIIATDTVINDISPKDLEGSQVSYIFSQNGDHYIVVRVFRKGQEDYCYTEVTKTITVGSNKPYLRLAELKYDYPRQILQISWRGWLIVFLPLIPALWFLYRWWKKRNENPVEKTDAELAAEYPILDAAPYYIPYLPQEEKISVPREFFRIAEILRRRENAERKEFDAQISVKATIAAGGFPTWRDQAKTRPAEYLFLIKRPDERDQQFRLFERLADFMTRRDAPIITYFHDGRFDRFWTDSEEKSIDLQQLNRQFPQHRLIVLGDGHDLVHPAPNGSPALLSGPVQSLFRWPRRLLLTPEAVSGWSYQEFLLHHVFPIFPADTDGILQGLEMLDRVEEYQSGSFEKWQEEQQRRRPEASQRYRNVYDVDSLKQMFATDPDLWRWCQALAVCAQPDWSLTIAVGRAIGVDVTHDRLLALTRVDWLRRNEPDDHLRLELLKTLDPEDEKAARYAVTAELEQVEEQVKNGFAATEWAANLAVQRFALDPRDKSHKESIQHLQRLGLLSGGQVAELEWVLERNQLITGSGAKLKQWLGRKDDDSWVTDNLLWALCLMPLSLALGICCTRYDQSTYYYSQEKISYLQTIKTLDDQAITLNNQAVEIGQRIGKEKSYTRWLGYAEDSQQADTLWGQAIALRQPKGYVLADSNRYAQRFNKAAQLLNFYLSDSIPRNEFRNDSIALVYTGQAFSDMVNASYWQTNDPRRTDAQHAMGLCYFYLRDMAVAKKAYQLILGTTPAYFDTLSMTVNLQTLLAEIAAIPKPKHTIRVLVLDAGTGKYIPNVTIIPENLSVLRTNVRGFASYNFPSEPTIGKIKASIGKEGYEPWTGTLQPRTSGLIDTIRLQLPKREIPTELDTDRDGDGVVDTSDECPDQQGTKESKGCPDTDNDGIADKYDKCPLANGSAATEGCPDLDGDGIPDNVDKCPDQFGSAGLFGCPDNQEIVFTKDSTLLDGWSSKGLSPGDAVGNFRLKNVDGRYLNFFDIIGSQGAIIVFLSNWDPYCQLYEQRIIDLHRTFANLGFPVVAISPNSPLIIQEDSFEKMQERARSKYYPFVYLIDEDQKVYPMFGATRTPAIYLMDTNRIVRYIGAIDNNPEAPDKSTKRWAENAVNALIKGEKPNPEFTRAVGCTIKKKPK